MYASCRDARSAGDDGSPTPGDSRQTGAPQPVRCKSCNLPLTLQHTPLCCVFPSGVVQGAAPPLSSTHASRKTPFVTGAGTHAHWKSSEFAYLSSMARMLRATDAVGHLAAHAASSLACRLVPWQAQRRCCFHRVMAECPCLNRPCGAPCVRPMHVARSLSQVTAAHMGCARHSAAHAARLELTGCSREKLHPAPRTLLVRAMDHPGSASNSQASGGAQCDI